MKLFHTLRICFCQQFIYLNVKNQNSSLSWRNALFVLILLQLAVQSLAFLLFEASTHIEFGNSFYMWVNATVFIYNYLIYIKKRHDIPKFIEQFEQFIEKRLQHSESYQMYIEMDANVEKVSKCIYVALMKVSTLGSTLPALFKTIFEYYMSSSTEDLYFLPYVGMFPFDWRTPFGYFIAFLSQFIATFSVCLSGATTSTIIFTTCWVLAAFIIDISNDLQTLNLCKNVRGNQLRVKKRFCDIIQLLGNVRQLTTQFNAIYEFIIFGLSVWTLSTVCSSLLVLHFELSSSTSNPANIIQPLFFVFWALAPLFLACECGERVSSQFEAFDVTLRNSNWYLLDIETQRIILIAMSISQNPVFVQGYANTMLLRFYFKKVINVGFSYFMMIRKMNI